MDEYEKRLESYLRRIEDGTLSTRKNCESMWKFHQFCEANGISPARQTIIFAKLYCASKIVNKDFGTWDRKDMELLFSKLRKKYSAWSIETVKNVLKTFFRWYYKTKDCPEFLAWAKGESVPNKLTSKDLLTAEEIEKLLETAQSPMWKGLIALLSSGVRPGEAYNVRIKDVVDLGDKIKVFVAGKMRKKLGSRPAYVLPRFAPYLRAWLMVHPLKGDPEAWLFVIKKKDGYARIGYCSVGHILRKIGMRAIGRPVYPYILRHSFGTYAYSQLGPIFARRLMGHAPGSTMESVYCHLSEADLEDAIDGKARENNGFDFGNIVKVDTEEKEFWEFVNAKKDQFKKLWHEWKAEKKQ